MKNLIAVFAVIFLLSITTKAQTLSGFVYDINGTPLPSSTVIVDGSIGVFCDYNGHYEINALSIGKHSIEFSFIGYLKQTFEIDITKGENNLNARLNEDAVLINDVVVVGYGVQRRKEVTGSIAKIDAKKITAVQTPSFEAALQGQAAGVQVSQSSGAAGAGSLIRIRGVASISGSGDPLVVVDGIPITQEYFLNRRARIRMNSINNERVYMRSLATRQSNLALSKHVSEALNVLKAVSYTHLTLPTNREV